MEAFRGPSLDGDLHEDDGNGDDVKGAKLSDAAQTTIHDIFRQLDRNHDGKLQIPELKASPARWSTSILHRMRTKRRAWRTGADGGSAKRIHRVPAAVVPTGLTSQSSTAVPSTLGKVNQQLVM